LYLKSVSTENELDTGKISENLKGYSGSDIANVCRDAAMMSMRRRIQGKSPSEIRMLRREEIDLPVTFQDFEDAISKTRKSVSQADVERFEKWMNEYGSC
jgi:katanin p60 ATPase-containing subunit A1